ncbi:MAG: hypothetical protein M1816_003533 [Peltula sp. TS41687]|nr:MAG: hypothetical protein M1816_003533 [Peltula sp. TS41687]
MDPHNLQKASDYINNLLLSRGLLRNGENIDFDLTSTRKADCEAVSAKIINLVHDLVLRRDRESEHREHLALTIQNLRSSEAKNHADIGRLQFQNAELDRHLSLAQGQEHSLKANVRRAEDAAKSVREEMQRLKTTLKNVRAQTAIEARQQDLEIRRLRSHLEAKQRGTRVPPTAPASAEPCQQRKDAAIPLTSPDYSLSQESSEFLAQLCQNLSDENDGLIALVQSSLARLRSLQGLQNATAVASGNGNGGGHTERRQTSQQSHVRARSTLALPTPCETLAAEMQTELKQLQKILTNPSSVPIEEVEAREEEIARLRQGWEKMEGRWREAVAMMDGWRRRIADDGTLVDGEGSGQSPVKISGRRDGIDDHHDHDDEGTHYQGSDGKEDSCSNYASTPVNVPATVTRNTLQSPETPDSDKETSLDHDQHRSGHVLTEIHLNIEESKTRQRHNTDASSEETNQGVDQGEMDILAEISPSEPPRRTPAPQRSPQKNQIKAPPSTISRRQSPRKRQASTEVPATQQQPKTKIARVATTTTTTIEQKLRDVKDEADEAVSRTAMVVVGRCERETKIPAKSTRKGTTAPAAARPRKKRHTLSPEELEYLLGVS